jgi:type I restriction enzyme S subunit
MESNWPTSTIAEVSTRVAMGPFGSNIKTDNFVHSGVPVIRGNNLTRGLFNSDSFAYLTEEKADELRNSNAYPNDIVFTHRGTLGQVGIIPCGEYERYVVSQSQMVLTCDPSKLDPLFLYYFFKSPMGQHALLMNTSQTGVPAISTPVTSLKKIRIPVPPLPEQRAIASILGSLDDKIELNRRMNKTLEEMAAALFKSWFVDFDPVRAKSEGRKPFGMDAETAALFPDRFVETEEGEIPEGWEWGRIGDLGQIVTGKTPPTKIEGVFEGTTPFLTPTDIDSELSVQTTKRYLTSLGVEHVKKCLLPSGTVCVTCIGSDMGKTVLVSHPTVTNQQINSLVPTNEHFRYFALIGLRQRKNELHDLGGSGSTMPILNKTAFGEVQTILPPSSILVAFGTFTSLLINKICQNVDECSTLAELRDTLLPKLLSGEIRVKEAEREVGEAV